MARWRLKAACLSPCPIYWVRQINTTKSNYTVIKVGFSTFNNSKHKSTVNPTSLAAYV